MDTATFTPIGVRTFTCSGCKSVWETCEERTLCIACEMEQEAGLTCPACEQKVEFLFSSTGICLDCEVDLWNNTVTEYEEREAGEWGAERCECGGC